MNVKKAISILSIFVIGLCTIGIASASHVGDHGAAYMTPDGLAELKAGSLEIGKYLTWGDADYHHHKSCVINVNGVDYTIWYKIAGSSGAKITGVEKVGPEPTPVPPTPTPENDTPGNDTPTPTPTPTPVPQNDTPVVPVVPGNETEPSNGANATADVDEVSSPAKLMKAPIKMQKAGNEWIPLVIAIVILVIICGWGYKRY